MTLSEVVLATTPGSLSGKLGLALNSLVSGLDLIIELLAMLILIGCTLGFTIGFSALGFVFFTSIADFLLCCFTSAGAGAGAATWRPTRTAGTAGGEILGDSTAFSRTPLAREGDLSGFGDILIRLGECLAWLGGELLGDTLWFWLLISAL